MKKARRKKSLFNIFDVKKPKNLKLYLKNILIFLLLKTDYLLLNIKKNRMFSKLKSLCLSVYFQIGTYLKDLLTSIKSNLINSVTLKKEVMKKEDLLYFLEEKQKSIYYVIKLFGSPLTFPLYVSYMSVLKEKLHLSTNIARLRLEMACYPENMDNGVVFSPGKTYTLYEDTYSSDILVLYRDILKLGDSYNIKSIVTLQFEIKLYDISKLQKKTLHSRH